MDSLEHPEFGDSVDHQLVNEPLFGLGESLFIYKDTVVLDLENLLCFLVLQDLITEILDLLEHLLQLQEELLIVFTLLEHLLVVFEHKLLHLVLHELETLNLLAMLLLVQLILSIGAALLRVMMMMMVVVLLMTRIGLICLALANESKECLRILVVERQGPRVP